MSDIKFKPYTPKQEKFGASLIKKVGKWQVKVYELTGGRLWNTFLGGPVAILTSKGRKSGEARKTPLLFIEDKGNVVMAASKGGMSTLPLWWKNLEATPQCQIQIRSRKGHYVARMANEEEEKELWPKLDKIYDGYAEYRARVEGVRHIPVIIFEPAGAAD
jgi:deazaflavin-dependent oxidoreductase (nitroreductase family)